MKKKNSSGPRFFKPAPKPQRPTTREFDITIERLSDEGRGIGFVDGKTVFVPLLLPRETARVRTREEKRTTIEAELVELTTASPQRIEPRCPLFGRCGGCQLQMLDDAAQLAHKQQMLERLLAPFTAARQFGWEMPITASPWSYRHRARLAVSDDGERPILGFKSISSHRVVEVSTCPILDDRLQPLLKALPDWLAQLKQWRRLEEVLIAVDANGKIALDWNAQRAFPKSDADTLAALAKQAGIAVGSDIELIYRSPQTQSEFRYTLRDFTQINPAINDLLAQRVLNWLAPVATDVVADLFCGLGNFTLPLAKRAQAVIGYEVGAAMVQRAQVNANRADIASAEFRAIDLFEQAEQLPDQFDSVLLDPPRAGAKAVCERLAKTKRVRRIVYVSCNPQTLVRDLGILAAGGFVLERAALVDMFPQTGHCEAVAHLSRKF